MTHVRKRCLLSQVHYAKLEKYYVVVYMPSFNVLYRGITARPIITKNFVAAKKKNILFGGLFPYSNEFLNIENNCRFSCISYDSDGLNLREKKIRLFAAL